MARNIAVGVGIMEYPFQTSDGFWRWVDLCEQGGLDSIWQTDRIVSRTPILECMTTPRRHRRTHPPPEVRRQCRVGCPARTGAAGQAVRHNRRAIERAAAARFRHRQPARRRVDVDAHRHHHPRPQDRRSAGDHQPAVGRRGARLRRPPFQTHQDLDRPGPGAARPADVDRRLVRGGDQAHRPRWHRLAGRRRDPPNWSAP